MVRATGGSSFTVGFGSLGLESQDVRMVSPKKLTAPFENLEVYFLQQLRNVTENLVKSGVPIAQKALREARTKRGWGESRMAGNRFGVSFAPFGRSAGREETGFMYDSLSWNVVRERGDSDGKSIRGSFGWSPDVLRQAPYITFQVQGFYSTGAFDPVATKKAGQARFTAGRQKFVEGAFPLTPARKNIEKRVQAAYSAAWNEAKKQWKSNGFAGSPGSYRDARGVQRTGSRRA